MFDGSEPIYLQIAQSIRDDIIAGRLEDGDQVMSTAQFAKVHRINPATTTKGFSLLVDEGLIHKRRGLGMFVSEGAHARLVSERRAAYFTDVLEPALAEARALGIDVADIVAYMSQGAPR